MYSLITFWIHLAAKVRAGNHYWIKRATQEEVFIGKYQLMYLQNPIILVQEGVYPQFQNISKEITNFFSFYDPSPPPHPSFPLSETDSNLQFCFHQTRPLSFKSFFWRGVIFLWAWKTIYIFSLKTLPILEGYNYISLNFLSIRWNSRCVDLWRLLTSAQGPEQVPYLISVTSDKISVQRQAFLISIGKIKWLIREV